MTKRIVILGSTGSIGENALRVVKALPGRLQVVGLAAERNVDRLLEQARAFGVKNIAVADAAAADKCRRQTSGRGVRILSGQQGVAELAGIDKADTVLCAVVGIAGLAPVLAALERGKDVALATKEVLVAAGKIVMETAARNKARVLPVDSEHCAVHQCVDGKPAGTVRRILLTASGGPFGSQPRKKLDRVTVAEVLKHPRWRMGKKVTVDSATLMNKGLEIMEAHWLFRMPLEAIDVVMHPESIVHSIVEFVDGSMLAQLSVPDMRFAIQYALTYPERLDGALPGLDLVKTGSLHFARPDETRFPCLRLAREAAERGGTLPAVLNAANEVAVQRFLKGRIPFPGIWAITERVMNKHVVVSEPTLKDVIAADGWARLAAEEN